MTQQEPRLGSFVLEALATYDGWQASDADDDAYEGFRLAMENMRRQIVRMVDREDAR